jgi:hypothetical protein
VLLIRALGGVPPRDGWRDSTWSWHQFVWWADEDGSGFACDVAGAK